MPIFGRPGESLSTRLLGKDKLPFTSAESKRVERYVASKMAEPTHASTLDNTFVGADEYSYGYPNIQKKPVYFPTSGSGNKSSSGGNSGGSSKGGSSKGGSSKGGSSKGGSSKDGSSKDAQAKKDAARKKMQSSIKNSFSSTISNYKNAINSLPGEQEDSMAQINILAGTQAQSITDALNQALAKFGGYREEVTGNQKQTLQDLADNTRNLFQAGNNYLGARGAGNSSATGMYSAALTQQANKQRGDIQNQTNDQYNDLNIAEQDTRNEAQNKINEINTWKATQQATIVSQYQDLKRQLQGAYANASDMQKQAIAQLDTQLYQQAAASLSNIQNVASQFQSQFGAGLGEQAGQTGEMVNAVSSGANNYQVGQVVTQELAGISQGQTQQDGSILDQATGNLWKWNEDGTLTYLGKQ